jgi:Uma2 family endonuclease
MSVALTRAPEPFDGKQFAVEDLASLPSEDPSGPIDYELDNGRLLTMVPPGDMHGAVQLKIGSELLQQGQRRGLGVARSEVGIILWRNPDRLVGADAAFILSESLPLRHSPEGYLETVPELVVEVRSKNDTNEYIDRKINDYLSAGVRILLVIDPVARNVTVFRPKCEPQVFLENDALTLEGVLPDFRCSVAELFHD